MLDIKFSHCKSRLLPVYHEVFRFCDAPDELKAAGDAKGENYVEEVLKRFIVVELSGRVVWIGKSEVHRFLELVEAEAHKSHTKQPKPEANCKGTNPNPEPIPEDSRTEVYLNLFLIGVIIDVFDHLIDVNT